MSDDKAIPRIASSKSSDQKSFSAGLIYNDFTRADEATFKVGCNYFPESGLGAKNVLSREK